MKKTYRKVILRTMKSSVSRLAAIAAIVALGVGLLAGLFAMPINMRTAADAYFDRMYIHDLRIVSPLGLTEDDVAVVEKTQGVTDVMPAHFTDVFIDAGEEKNIVTRVHSLPTDQIEEREPVGYLNRIEVLEGRLPLRRAECVLVAGGGVGGVGALGVGGTVRLSGTNGDISDTLYDTEYKVVGIVRTAYYCSLADRESASIGNGTVAMKMYVPEECFSQKVYSEIFAAVAGAWELRGESAEYEALVAEVAERIEAASGARCEARYKEVKEEGERELDKARTELAKARSEADEKLADAADQLAEGRDEVEDGETELDRAKRQIEQGEKELSQQIQTLPDTLTQKQQELADGKAALLDAQQQIAEGEREIERGRAQLEAKKEEIAAGRQTLKEKRQELADAKRELSDAKQEISDAKTQLSMTRQLLVTARKMLLSLEPSLSEAESQRDDLGAKLPPLQANVESARAKYAQACETLGMAELEQAYAAAQKDKADRQAAEAASQAAQQAVTDSVRAYMQAAGWTPISGGYTKTEEDGTAATWTDSEAEADWAQYSPDAPALLQARTDAAAALEAFPSAESLETAEITAWGKLSAAQVAVSPQKIALEAAQAELDVAQSAYDMADTSVNSLRGQMEDAKKDIASYEKEIADGEAQITAGEAQIAAGEAQIAEGEKQLAEAEAQIDAGLPQLEEAEAQLDAAEDALWEGKKQLAEAEKQVSVGQMQLEMAPDLARLQIELAEKQLASAREQYEAGLEAWESGKTEFEKGEKEYERQKKSAAERLADAEEQIAEAQRELDDLEVPEWMVLDRGSHVGWSGFLSNVDKLEAITTVFPVFFFLVAALVALTTMTRMVEEERLQIGTLKALGYKRGQIMLKYLLYAWIATLLGGAVGLAFGFTAIPLVIWNAYGIMYSIPDFHCLFHPYIALAGVGAALLCTTFATLNACSQTLREWAAQLLLPKAPKAGKRIFLERITPIWSRMKFTHKVTARNLLRYKKRFFMTVVGVAGCTALLVTGFGLQDSIGDIIAKQFGDIFTYDFMLTLSSSRALENKDFTAHMDDAAQVKSYLPVRQERTEVEQGGDECPVYLFTPSDSSRMGGMIDLHERKSRRAVPLTDDGIVVTEKFAERLKLSTGDSVTVENTDGKKATFPITGIAENYVENYIYLTPENYERAYGTTPTPNSVLGTLAEGAADEDEAFSAALLDVSGVAGFTWMSVMRRSLDDTIESINYVVYVVILCAGMLAFVVLYNLLNINITERTKEIATIKVLGFFEREVGAYVSRESNVLTLIGMCVGLVLGIFLHAFIMRTVEVDLVMFGRQVKPLSFVYSAALTVVFSVLVDLVLRRKLRNISMVESMKAPE